MKTFSQQQELQQRAEYDDERGLSKEELALLTKDRTHFFQERQFWYK